MGNIRFSELVKQSGRPEPKSLWTDPKADRQFARAIRQNRVLTVVQEPSAKRKDFGEIGFRQGPHASYFVFPKPLPSEKAKVVGIKYDLVEEVEPSDVLSVEELEKGRNPRRSAARGGKLKSKSLEKGRAERRIEPVLKTFLVRVRAEAVVENTIEIEARDKREAKTKGEEMAKSRGVDFANAKIKTKVQFLRQK